MSRKSTKVLCGGISLNGIRRLASSLPQLNGIDVNKLDLSGLARAIGKPNEGSGSYGLRSCAIWLADFFKLSGASGKITAPTKSKKKNAKTSSFMKYMSG